MFAKSLVVVALLAVGIAALRKLIPLCLLSQPIHYLSLTIALISGQLQALSRSGLMVLEGSIVSVTSPLQCPQSTHFVYIASITEDDSAVEKRVYAGGRYYRKYYTSSAIHIESSPHL